MKILIDDKYLFKNENMTIGAGSSCVTMKQVNTLRKILMQDDIKTVSEYFFKVKDVLNCDDDDLKSILSQKNKNIYFDYLKENITYTKKYVGDYINTVHNKKNELFEKIVAIPGQDIPLYDDLTRTGRMRITSGPSYITMKKEDRKKIKVGDRIVFEIDFKSCEPSFYLFSKNVISPCQDVYSELLKFIDQKISRDKFKIGFLSLMYGGGDDMVGKISGLSPKSIKTIKEKIKVEDFKSNLESAVDENNIFLNYYGRPLIANNNMINYYIQSSAADFYCLAFNKLLNERKEIMLHACIHDAILCSIDKNNFKTLENINFLSDGVSNLKLPVNIEVY